MTTIFSQAAIACIHNPAAGNELELGADTLTQAKRPLRVAVAGGGPAGMRAAVTLAARGHRVTLFERQARLGGQIRLWAKAPSRRELTGIIDWLDDQLRDRQVDIRLNSAVDAAQLQRDGFDSVVVATGATGLRHGWTPLHPARWNGPALSGADQPNVHSYLDYLEHEPSFGERVLVVDSLGGRQGAVVAEVLATSGHRVEFVTQLPQASPDLAASRDWGKVHSMLRKLGVRFTVDCEVTRIDGAAVTLRDVYTRDESRREADAIVFVIGAMANDSLFHALEPRRAAGLGLHLIGDALAPRRASDAIREGEIVAREI